MATNYPGGIDTTTELPNDQTDDTLLNRGGVDHAQEHVNLSDAVRAVEGELGTDPAGAYSTVKARLDAVVSADPAYTLASSVSAGATSVTLNRAITGVVSNQTFVVIDAFTTSCEIRRATTISGSAASGLTALASAHSSGARVGFFQGYNVPASWFGITGSGSDEEVGLQRALDQTQPLNLRLDGESRTFSVARPVVWGPNQVVAHMTIKAHASFAPVDTTNAVVVNSGRNPKAFTSATDDIVTATAHGLDAGNTVLFKGAVPTGITAGRLYFARDTTANTFKVAATSGGAAIDLTTTGSGMVYPRAVSLNKVYVEDVIVDGNSLAGVNGAMLYIQQQSQLHKFRTNNCPGTGLHLTGQQAEFFNYQSLDCGKALVLDNSSFMYFYGTNLENFTKGIHIITSAQSPLAFGGGAFACGFWGLHMECNDSATAVFCDHEGSHHQIMYDTVQMSQNTNGVKGWYVHTGDPATSGYTIREARFSGGSEDVSGRIAISDTDRSISLDIATDFHNRIPWFVAPRHSGADAYTDPQEFMIAGKNGRYLKWGATNFQTPSWISRPASDQTAPQSLWRNSSDNDRLAVTPTGAIDLTEQTLPAAPAANTGRLFVRDNGSGKSQAVIRFPSGAEQVIATEP